MTKITIDRAVVEQALGALDGTEGLLTSMDVTHLLLYVEVDNAITALRAALEEPVQEPVAKVELMTTGGNAGLATRIVEIDDHLRERLRPGQLLYTTPPQRKPLTEEEIDNIWDSEKAFADIYAIARAIERAHGIGDNT